MTLGNSPQPLTRRQLRELARENEPASAPSEPVTDAPATAPHESRHTAHTDDFPTTVAEPAAVEPAAVEPAVAEPAVVKPVAARPAPLPLPVPAEAPAPANAVVIDSVVVDPGHGLTRRELRALQAAAAASSQPLTEDALATRSVPGSLPVAAATHSTAGSAGDSNGLNPPIGHWSIDRDDDSHIEAIGRRDDQTFDDLVGLGVGAGGIPTTTNALILPADPRQGIAGPITTTGEIMITGSIDLPRSLGATGQHPNLFDSSEMDRMLDQLDEGGHHNDVAPVSASRAVSTHTSTRGVMTPPRKRGASLPAVLAITAAVLLIGVLSLFVVGYAFNIY